MQGRLQYRACRNFSAKNCYEETGTPIFFMENCCYNKDEALATALVRKGLLGEVVYRQGYYCHDLREEIAGGIDTHHYRLKEYTNHNCENYPTHPLTKRITQNTCLRTGKR